MSAASAEPLLHLLKAAAPSTVTKILVDTFRYRNEGLSENKLKGWSEILPGSTTAECKDLFTALVPLIRESLYRNAEKASEVAELLPSGFHPDLGKLLGKQISKQIPAWRQSALQNQISPPRLLDVDWRVDMQTSSNLLARMAVPTVFVEMKLQEPPQKQGVMPGVQSVQFELSKQALATMLHGLEKINEQLGSIK